MNQKKFVNIILIVVVVIIVIVGGYFVLSKKPVVLTEKSTTPTDNGLGSNQTTIPSDGTIIDVSNLSLYRNESCGFEIKFPEQLVEDIEGDQLFNEIKKVRYIGECPSSTPYDKEVYVLRLVSRPDCRQNEAAEYPAGCQIFQIEVTNNKVVAEGTEIIKKNIIVDNIPAEKFSPLILDEAVIRDEVVIQEGVGQILIQLEKNNLWYRYTHTFPPSDIEEAEKLSDLIISTFKFIR